MTQLLKLHLALPVSPTKNVILHYLLFHPIIVRSEPLCVLSPSATLRLEQVECPWSRNSLPALLALLTESSSNMSYTQASVRAANINFLAYNIGGKGHLVLKGTGDIDIHGFLAFGQKLLWFSPFSSQITVIWSLPSAAQGREVQSSLQSTHYCCKHARICHSQQSQLCSPLYCQPQYLVYSSHSINGWLNKQMNLGKIRTYSQKLFC